MSKDDKDVAQVFHFDLYGKREDKYDFLDKNSMSSISWRELKPSEPDYFFVEKDYSAFEDYQKGFKIDELFPLNNVGIVTSRDSFVINGNKKQLENRILDFFELDKKTLQSKYSLKENKSWKIDEVKEKAKGFEDKFIKTISYRPFDNQYIYYDNDFIERSRTDVMHHLLYKQNYSLVVGKQCVSDWRYIFISNLIGEFNLTSTAGRFGSGYYFPLYLYPDSSKGMYESPSRKPNLNMEIVDKIAKDLNLAFVEDDDLVVDLAEGFDGTLYPLNILDYIYAVLHAPSYREKYKEFLKIDFPRVPYPTDKDKFWKLVTLGKQIRELHLLESPKLDDYNTTFPVAGENVITRKITKNDPGFIPESDNPNIGKVWINEEQYFDKVPLIAWEFYIGGYQPAQKWLKDRHGRTLDFEAVLHYQKMIVVLTETDRLMKEVDEVIGKV